MYKLQETLYNGSIKSTKEHEMIRIIFGLVLVFGGVGGIDNDENLLLCTAIAFTGLALMYFGTKKINANIS